MQNSLVPNQVLEESSEVRHVTDEKRGETRKRKSRLM